MYERIERLYENLIPLRDRYSAKRKYPKPDFYVFYNGDAPYPQYKELCLSELFYRQNAWCVVRVNCESDKHKLSA